MEDQLGQKEVINQLQDRKRYLGQIVSENLANHSIKRSKSSIQGQIFFPKILLSSMSEFLKF